MKKFILLFMLFSFLSASQLFAAQPTPKNPLEKAMYCYLNTGLLSNWKNSGYNDTFIYNYHGIPQPEDKISPYVARTPFEMAVLVTDMDKALDAGLLYLGYWDQEKNVEGNYVFDVSKVTCSFTSASKTNCVTYLQLNIGNGSFPVRFESKEKLNGTKRTVSFRGAYFITDEENKRILSKKVEIHPTKVPHAGVPHMIALRAKEMLLSGKDAKKEQDLKDSFKAYCNLEKLKNWDVKDYNNSEGFQE